MGTRERRERERQGLRQAILAAARTIAHHEGWSAVTIRKVADLIEYSPPTIYEHFENKDAIMTALILEGAEQLATQLEQSKHVSQSPLEVLQQMGRTYWQFAIDQLELYQIMHGIGGAPLCPPEVYQAQERVVLVALEPLRQLRPDLDELALYNLVDALWGTLHGLLSLATSDQMDGGTARAQGLADQAVTTLLLGWQHPKTP